MVHIIIKHYSGQVHGGLNIICTTDSLLPLTWQHNYSSWVGCALIVLVPSIWFLSHLQDFVADKILLICFNLVRFLCNFGLLCFLTTTSPTTADRLDMSTWWIDCMDRQWLQDLWLCVTLLHISMWFICEVICGMWGMWNPTLGTGWWISAA